MELLYPITHFQIANTVDYFYKISISITLLTIFFLIAKKAFPKLDRYLKVKYFLSFLILLILFDFLTEYLSSTPELVLQVVEQISTNSEIQEEMGGINGFKYNKNEIAEIRKFPTEFTLTLIGKKGEQTVRLIIEKENEKYKVIEIRKELSCHRLALRGGYWLTSNNEVTDQLRV